MGLCFSSSSIDYSENQASSSAKVISLNGNLTQYSAPVRVSHVLNQLDSSNSCILCNSDHLLYDDYVKALGSEEEIQLGQIYFVLEKSRLKYRLTASDMAALAVKASSAFMKSSSTKKGRRSGGRKKLRISPVFEVHSNNYYEADNGFESNLKRFDDKPMTVEMKRSGSVRKLHKSASRRAKIAIRSFRMRLNTIYEGHVVE
ncbi:hypothetical protein C5167_024608 [Papaver somniferum]|uniref:Uncharacterized protein n=1 Tax=Papaver somniferum TaxID=3469 RepID=A0A4Y7JP32_PAPSO|nr:uncharacterized protein LOC113280006 [Papaver somniferum]RZC62853.1 hypothetical protein C5167_024608 [Papaver somniferum]